MLNFCLFGAGQAKYFGRSLSGFPNQQASLLLCYLLLNRGHSYHREQLAAVFWGDYPVLSARKNFRNTLWKMRQTLQSVGAPPDEYLFANEETITFLQSSPYWLDVEILESAAVETQSTPGQQLTEAQAARLTQATALYTGDLLEGVYEDWVLYDRERLRLIYLNALTKLMGYQGSQGAFERAIEFGERILARDPTRENIHRQLMIFYWCSGNRSGALAQYKRCSQILRQEIGTTPMEETRALYEQMLQSRFDPNLYRPVPAQRNGEPAASGQKYDTEMMQNALNQIRLLHKRLEETTRELYQIEELIRTVLPPS